jgi:hypothetical protein
MDNDSRMCTLGGILTLARGDVISVTLRRVELNRDGGPHTVSQAPLDVDNVELRYSRGLRVGNIDVGVGYQQPVIGAERSYRLHGFVMWQQGF